MVFLDLEDTSRCDRYPRYLGPYQSMGNETKKSTNKLKSSENSRLAVRNNNRTITMLNTPFLRLVIHKNVLKSNKR